MTDSARARFQASRHTMRDADAMTIYRLASAALAEQDAEISRLHEELAVAQNRAVLHATGAKCEQIIASGEADNEVAGTLLRSTDDKRIWEMTTLGWQLR